jgi:hypothetical protein
VHQPRRHRRAVSLAAHIGFLVATVVIAAIAILPRTAQGTRTCGAITQEGARLPVRVIKGPVACERARTVLAGWISAHGHFRTYRGWHCSDAIGRLLLKRHEVAFCRGPGGASIRLYEPGHIRPWRDCGTVRVLRPLFGHVRKNRVEARVGASCATARYIGRRFVFGGYGHRGLRCFYAGMGSGNPYWNWSCDQVSFGRRTHVVARVRGHGPSKVKSASGRPLRDVKLLVSQKDDKRTVHLRVGDGVSVHAGGRTCAISVDPPEELEFIPIPTPFNVLFLQAVRPGTGTLTAACKSSQGTTASFGVKIVVSP